MRRQRRANEAAAINELRPTQITVGYLEVARKRRRLGDEREMDGRESANEHTVTVVRGPRSQLFIVDRHHFVRALFDEGVDTVGVSVIADLSALTAGEFWEVCEERGWSHPYDAAGVRRDVSAIPLSVAELSDDPFRSLAGALRRAGGFTKASTPYSEFSWADFLRRRLQRGMVESDFDGALRCALKLARTPQAAHLPGWRAGHGVERERWLGN